MVLRAPYVSVAIDLQEAADMMHSDVTSRLSNAVQDAHRDSGTYAYYIDHNGDGESGDVIYGSSGSRMSAPYEIQSQGGKTVANIDTANAQKVAMRATYEPMADDDDNYASMMEAKLYTKGDSKPLCERFISKNERSAASDDDFAGKGKSFPILKAGDVMAAVRSMGRAGSDNYGPSKLKANIIAKAKAKGFESELPKTWRGDTQSSESTSTGTSTETSTETSTDAYTARNITVTGGAGAGDTTVTIVLPGTDDDVDDPAVKAASAKEAARLLAEAQASVGNPGTSRTSSGGGTGDGGRRASESNRFSSSNSTVVPRAALQSIKLSESVAFPTDIPLREAFKPSYQIKLIAPGPGSSAFYPAEVLKRDGPKVFKAGTPMRIDHPTRAEEAARPEGSVKDWGAVLAKDAYWLDEHKQGPGLYGEIKPFSDHVATIAEKGAYAGVSIRANGHAVMESGKPVMKNGVPVLASITSAEGVDMVTRAGAGGMFLSESARVAANQQEVSMTETEVKAMITVAVTEATAPLRERAHRGDATVAAHALLGPLALAPAAKQMIVENVLRESLPMKDGALDEEKFGLLVEAEAKRVAAVIVATNGGGRVRGMGAGAPVSIDPKVREAEALRAKDEEAEAIQSFRDLGLSESAAKAAVKGRAA